MGWPASKYVPVKCFTSSDFGTTWNISTNLESMLPPNPSINIESLYSFSDIDTSGTGQYILLLYATQISKSPSGYGPSTNAILSSDYGNTWSQVTNLNTLINQQIQNFLLNNNWNGNYTNIQISTTGQYMLVSCYSSFYYIFMSLDYGQTWSSLNTYQLGNVNSGFSSIAMSSSGSWIYGINYATVPSQTYQNIFACYHNINQCLGFNPGDFLSWSGNLYDNWSILDQNINLGSNAGFTGQGDDSIAIGYQSGYYVQYSNSISIGNNSGYTNQGCTGPVTFMVIDGESVPQVNGQGAVAIGPSSGENYQGPGSVAIGNNAGYTGQAQYSVAVGNNAGYISQGQYSVAVGNNSGYYYQGNYSISIGNNNNQYYKQPTNSIILNSSTNNINPSNGGFFVSNVSYYTSMPSSYSNLYYNTSTYEFFTSSSQWVSDYRIKKNIINIQNEESAKLYGLKPVIYFNKIFKRQEIGFIAHELQEIYPFLVTSTKDNNELQTINYASLIGLLINEIKKIKTKISILEKKASDL